MKFRLVSDFLPSGDQPDAIEKLVEGYYKYPAQTLLGVTGSGKTFTMANVIERVQNPSLILAHNKTLAAQLYNEFKNFFPENKVCYFISYYDYYQPESYLPQTDTYIEKEVLINEKIEQLRMEASVALMSRPDVIIVASISCIYGLGSPFDFKHSILSFAVGQKIGRQDFLINLIELLYDRNDMELFAGRFRVRGDIIDLIQGFGGDIYRFELFGSEIEKISILDPINLNLIEEVKSVNIFPAKPFMVPEDKRLRAIESIKEELKGHLPNLGLIESYRLDQRTNYDLEMIEELGYCKGIENYSRHFDGRAPGNPPFCLLDFFANNPFSKDFLIFIDESHVTIPQAKGMYKGDYTRKMNLIEHGFRLPSAYDNRPLKFTEFEQYLKHVIFTSATPSNYELKLSARIAEQIARPTGLIDPKIFVRPAKGQMDDLKSEITKTIEQGDRVLITTLTKRLAETLSEYLTQRDVKTRYLHSEINTLERSKLIKDLRLGVFDVLVGINLLREGLDIPEVGLVVILDADKEGFLRNATSLIQTIGRAARNVNSKVIMYADKMTDSIKSAIAETQRRRQIQIAYNEKHGIIPKSIIKAISDDIIIESEEKEYTAKDINKQIIRLEEEMKSAVEVLNFEKAIELRDKIKKYRKLFN